MNLRDLSLQTRNAVINGNLTSASIAADTSSIAGSLGADISGELGGKLDAIAALLEGGNVSAYIGASWPVSPTIGQPFFNTSVGEWGRWNGSNWIAAPQWITIPGYAVTPYAGAAPAVINRLPTFATAPYIITQIQFLSLHTGAPMSTNNWGFGLYRGAGTQIHSLDTSGNTSNVLTLQTHVPAATLEADSLYLRLDTKTGAPGALTLSAAVRVQRALG